MVHITFNPYLHCKTARDSVSMNSISDKISDSIPDLIEDGSSKQSIPDDYQSISTSQQPFDPSSYFDNPPFDDGLFRSFKGYEPYHSGLGYDPATTAMPSPTIHATSATCLPPGRNQEFPFRTRSDPQVPQSISAISSSFNEWLPSPNQYSADIGFGTSNEMESGAGTQIQSVRNSQLEKVCDFLFKWFS